MSELGAVLDVAIGLIFMYLMTSLLVTIVQEGIASALNLRGKSLFDAVANLLADPALTRHPDYKELVLDLYRHPLIRSLYRLPHREGELAPAMFVRKVALPSYIPSRLFAVALVDVLRGKTATEAVGMDRVLAGAGESVAKLPVGPLRTSLTLLVGDADLARESVNRRAELVSDRIEAWFDDSMARASGWYKRKSQKISLAIALALAVLINASTFNVAGRLWSDNALRAQVSATAAAYHNESRGAIADSIVAGSEDARAPSLAAQWNDRMKRLESSSLPIGWPSDFTTALPRDVAAWAGLIFGWLVTGLAASLGAAFWFDVLGKVLRIRGSGPRPAHNARTQRPVTVAATAAVDAEEGATSATVAVSSGQS